MSVIDERDRFDDGIGWTTYRVPYTVRVDLKRKVFSREFSLSEERQKTKFQYKISSIRNPV